MRLPWFVIFAAVSWAQPSVLSIPRVDGIEFYGLHQVTQQLARQALGVKEGDPLPPSKADIEDRLLDIDRVVSAHLEAVCCEGGKTILYVGLEEFGAPHYDIRPEPGGKARLPTGITAATKSAAQIDTHIDEIREVLRDSSDEGQRIAAVSLLLLAPRGSEVVEDLHQALSDNDSTVRSIAMRGLLSLLQVGRDPVARMKISTAWFVPMLNSISWSDRTQAASAIESLTRQRDKELLTAVRTQALEALIDMSHWRTEQYAYPPFQLIGRIAGETDVNIRDAWQRSGRDAIITKARAVK